MQDAGTDGSWLEVFHRVGNGKVGYEVVTAAYVAMIQPMKKPPLSREDILSLLDYDPVTARFTHRARVVRPGKQAAPDGTFNKRFAGKEAGHFHNEGYRIISLKYKNYYAHQLVWFLETGLWPNQLDHKNGNPDDNRIENLRECTHSQNCMNAGAFSHNTTGIKGVSFQKRTGKFYAYIKKDQIMRGLGLYASIEEAAEARRKAEIELFGEFRRE